MKALIVLAVTQSGLDLWEIICKGGCIMILLAVLSIIVFYIFFERNHVIRKAGKEDPMFMEKIKDYIAEGEIQAALTYCKYTDTPSSRMIEKGIKRLGCPVNEVQIAIENIGDLEAAKLEKFLPIMETIANAAPMLGFLGTVIGLVRIFLNMKGAGNADLAVFIFSDGIYEAMITTIGGILVGLLALFGHNYLVLLLNGVVNKMDAITVAFIDLVSEEKQTSK